MLASAAALLACGGDRNQSVAVDSVLARDLTLASSATSTAIPADTALSVPQATAPETPSPAPVPSRTSASPSRATTPTPIRQKPATERQTAPSRSEPAPAPAPVNPTPAASAAATTASTTDTAAGNTGAGAGTSGRAPTLGTGLILAGATNAEICSLANKPGDRFVVSLGQAVQGNDGAMLPAGTPVLVELASATAEGVFTFRLRGIQRDGVFIPAQGSVDVGQATVTERQISKGGDAGKVATGAVIGAILGRVIGGGNRGTVIGAAGGAAAGTVAAARNKVTERCLPAGVTLSATLTAPLVLSPATP
jgi:uncharacterized protein YcfJ